LTTRAAVQYNSLASVISRTGTGLMIRAELNVQTVPVCLAASYITLFYYPEMKGM
jgi:hypothetical protein